MFVVGMSLVVLGGCEVSAQIGQRYLPLTFLGWGPSVNLLPSGWMGWEPSSDTEELVCGSTDKRFHCSCLM